MTSLWRRIVLLVCCKQSSSFIEAALRYLVFVRSDRPTLLLRQQINDRLSSLNASGGRIGEASALPADVGG